LLRQHFGFKAHHLKQIEDIFKDLNGIAALRSKITELAIILSDRKISSQPVKDIPAWTIASIKNEFTDD
jgi:hypothetical protein